MTKIILTRHGHVEGIEPERFRGRTELPLTELGRGQAKAVAARIAKTWNIVKIYTSPMGRCIATGQEIAKTCCIANESLEALNDLDYGQWQWRTHDEVRNEWPALFAAWQATPHLVRFPKGDSLQDLGGADCRRTSLRLGAVHFRNGYRRLCRARQRQSSTAPAASRSIPFSVLADRSSAMRDKRDRYR